MNSISRLICKGVCYWLRCTARYSVSSSADITGVGKEISFKSRPDVVTLYVVSLLSWNCVVACWLVKSNSITSRMEEKWKVAVCDLSTICLILLCKVLSYWRKWSFWFLAKFSYTSTKLGSYRLIDNAERVLAYINCAYLELCWHDWCTIFVGMINLNQRDVFQQRLHPRNRISSISLHPISSRLSLEG